LEWIAITRLDAAGLVVGGFFTILSTLNVSMQWIEVAIGSAKPKNLKQTKNRVIGISVSFAILSILTLSLTKSAIYVICLSMFYELVCIVGFAKGSKIVFSKLQRADYYPAVDTSRKEILHPIRKVRSQSSAFSLNQQLRPAPKLGTIDHSSKRAIRALERVQNCAKNTSRALLITFMASFGVMISVYFPRTGSRGLTFISLTTWIFSFFVVNIIVLSYASLKQDTETIFRCLWFSKLKQVAKLNMKRRLMRNQMSIVYLKFSVVHSKKASSVAVVTDKI